MVAAIALPAGSVMLVVADSASAKKHHKHHKKKHHHHKKHKKGASQTCFGTVDVGTSNNSPGSYFPEFSCKVPVSSFSVTVNRPVVSQTNHTYVPCGASTPCAANDSGGYVGSAVYSCTITGSGSYSCSGTTTRYLELNLLGVQLQSEGHL